MVRDTQVRPGSNLPANVAAAGDLRRRVEPDTAPVSINIALPLIICLTFFNNLPDLRQGLGHLLIALLFSLASLVLAVVMPYWELGGFAGQGLRE